MSAVVGQFDGSVLLSKLVTQGVALCGFQMTRSESATVEEGFIGRASAPIAGTSHGSRAQMKMRTRSWIAGTVLGQGTYYGRMISVCVAVRGRLVS